jgi:hypothetical protein
MSPSSTFFFLFSPPDSRILGLLSLSTADHRLQDFTARYKRCILYEGTVSMETPTIPHTVTTMSLSLSPMTHYPNTPGQCGVGHNGTATLNLARRVQSRRHAETQPYQLRDHDWQRGETDHERGLCGGLQPCRFLASPFCLLPGRATQTRGEVPVP